jgi:lipopolysaccharide/colanic/teichoic acid biosynthesis glycosyltransferase
MAFRRLTTARINLLSAIEAVLTAGSYLAATYLLLPLDASVYLMYDGGIGHIVVVTLIFAVASYLFDFYKQVHVTSRLVVFLQLAHLIGVVLMIEAAFAFIDSSLVPPQMIVFAGTILTLATLSAWRLLARPAVWNAIGMQRLLLAGSSQATEQLIRAFRMQPSLGMEVTGYVGEEHNAPYAVPVMGGFADLRKAVAELRPDKVIVSPDGMRDKGILKTLFDLRVGGTTVESAGDVYEAIFGRVYSRGVEPYTVIFRNELSAPAGNVALQSIYTNVLALAAVVLLVPLIVLIAILLKITRRGGPVMAKHLCVGLHGIPFHRYRFQCNLGSPDLLSRLLLRFKLDALPQILNVVRGEMALIGPRAERVEFSDVMERLIPFYRQKQSVKPGIMGWSQLHCDTSPVEDSLARLEYDLYYLKHISLVLDLYTIIRAVKWMLSNPSGEQEGAALNDAPA